MVMEVKRRLRHAFGGWRQLREQTIKLASSKIQLLDGVRHTEDKTIPSDNAALKNVRAILDNNQVRTTNECIRLEAV